MLKLNMQVGMSKYLDVILPNQKNHGFFKCLRHVKY